MGTYLFAWNPDDWPWEDLPEMLEKIKTGKAQRDQWSIGKYKKPGPGDRFFLIKLGEEPKGLIGSGHITSKPFEDTHYADRKKRCNYVSIEFDFLVDGRKTVVISRKALIETEPFNKQHWDTQSSGISIRDEVCTALEPLWLSRVGQHSGIAIGEEQYNERETYSEGAWKTLKVNGYERDSRARDACIAHFGYRCAVCEIELKKFYGDVAATFIHVHHLRQLSTIGHEYAVDPIKDLRPVCTNCHAIIHLGNPAYSIEQVRAFVAKNRVRHP